VNGKELERTTGEFEAKACSKFWGIQEYPCISIFHGVYEGLLGLLTESQRYSDTLQ
jgi:hypothetical protein